MSLFSYDITIDENATFKQQFEFQDLLGAVFSLVGYTACKASLKKLFSDTTSLLDFTCVVDGPNGTITISAPAAATDALATTFPRPKANKDNAANKGVWDLFITDPSGNVIRMASGQAHVLARVTA